MNHQNTEQEFNCLTKFDAEFINIISVFTCHYKSMTDLLKDVGRWSEKFKQPARVNLSGPHVALWSPEGTKLVVSEGQRLTSLPR